MTVLPRIRVKRGTFGGLLPWLMRPRADKDRAPPSPALIGNRADLNLWRGYLHSSEETLHTLNLSLIGVPEDEIEPELCLVKGEVLRRAGHGFDAQRFLRQA